MHVVCEFRDAGRAVGTAVRDVRNVMRDVTNARRGTGHSDARDQSHWRATSRQQCVIPVTVTRDARNAVRDRADVVRLVGESDARDPEHSARTVGSGWYGLPHRARRGRRKIPAITLQILDVLRNEAERSRYASSSVSAWPMPPHGNRSGQ